MHKSAECFLFGKICGLSRTLRPCKMYGEKIKYADMAELADAHGSGPCESNFMQVQVLLSAPQKARFYRAFCYFATHFTVVRRITLHEIMLLFLYNQTLCFLYQIAKRYLVRLTINYLMYDNVRFEIKTKLFITISVIIHC